MGCIETTAGTGLTTVQSRLTLTWDVLKQLCTGFKYIRKMINFNMGCIETADICTPV